MQFDPNRSSTTQTLIVSAQYSEKGVKVYKADVMTKSAEKMLSIETEGLCTCVT